MADKLKIEGGKAQRKLKIQLNNETKKAFFVIPEDTDVKAGDVYGTYLEIFTSQDGTQYVDVPHAGRWEVQDLGAVGDDEDEEADEGEDTPIADSKKTKAAGARFDANVAVRTMYMDNDAAMDQPNNTLYKKAREAYVRNTTGR